MDLSQVSRTAILLLICRAVASEKNAVEFSDPMAVLSLERLLAEASEEDRIWISKHIRMYEGMHVSEAIAGTKRGKVIDRIAERFISDHPKCTIINLACGFDTRYWRIEKGKSKFIETDLPAVIDLKKEILKDQLGYEMIGKSVLDTTWIDQVTKKGNTDFLLIAEGLFMWLPPQEAIRLFKEIGERFTRSELVADMVPEKYTKGLWKKFIRLHSRMDFGLDVAWEFGIKDPQDIEGYSKSFKVIGREKSTAGPILTVSINAAK
jgi:O-methyltransferase involved in polyketide biosynthesis